MSAERLLYFLLGLTSGAAVTLLLTPASGEENREWLAEKSWEGAKRVVGEERARRGRAATARGREAVGLARDTADVVKRGSKIRRPLDEQ